MIESNCANKFKKMHSNMNLMCVATLIYMLHFSAPDCRNREIIKNYHTHTFLLILFSAYINDYNFSIRKISTLRVGSCVTFIMIKRKTTTIAWRQFFASASAKLFVSLLTYVRRDLSQNDRLQSS